MLFDNFGFRYYDPELGRFIQRDPAGYPDGANNYLYCNNNPINRIDPLGLKSKDVDDELVKKVQSITTEVEKMKVPKDLKGADAKTIGRWRHEEFQNRLNALNDPRILTEQGIQDLGILKGGKGSKRPDLIILKEGENVADLKKGASISGKVDAIVDLKTGVDDIKGGWADTVSKRLGVGVEDIHSVGNGRDLAKSFSTASERGALAKSALKYGAKSLGRAVIVAGVVMAYNLKSREL